MPDAGSMKPLRHCQKQIEKNALAYLAMKQIQAIYREENKLCDRKLEERLEHRQLTVKPLVEAYFAWAKESKSKVPAKGKTHNGLTYSINQEKYLKVFLEDGAVPMDNMTKRGQACGFCLSYKTTYYELNIDELQLHLESLYISHRHMIQRAKVAFLSDGDPLMATDIVDKLNFVRMKLPNICFFESFVSTNMILALSIDQWKNLKDIGLRKVYWGIESVDNYTLRIIDKPHNDTMIYNAQKILEKLEISYDAIIMSGIGCLDKKIRSHIELEENAHVNATTTFINLSKCDIVFVSKLQIPPDSKLGKGILKTIFPFSEDEIEREYRSMVGKIHKNVRGSYGNQFVIERRTCCEI